MAALADAGRLEEAVRLGESIAGQEQSTPDLFVLLGTLDAALGRAERAEGWFRRALYLAPEHAEALLHLSLLFARRGEAAAADRLRARVRRAGSQGPS